MAYSMLLRGLKLCKVFLKGILTYEVNGIFLEGIFTYQSVGSSWDEVSVMERG
jgi:hypothetical protein